MAKWAAMLSKVRDIDVFRVGKRTRRWSGIELYPKVYIPPHLIYLNKQITADVSSVRCKRSER